MAQITVAGGIHRMGVLVHATSQSVGWPTPIHRQQKTRCQIEEWKKKLSCYVKMRWVVKNGRHV